MNIFQTPQEKLFATITEPLVDTDRMSSVLASGKIDLNATYAGQTPLTLVCSKPYVANTCEAARLLIMNGADPNAKNEAGLSALMLMATGKRHLDTLLVLLENGADPETTDKNGATALMRYAAAGKKDFVAALLQAGADPNRVTPDTGVTALILAVIHSHYDVVETLLAAGADPAIRTKTGYTTEYFAMTDKMRKLLSAMPQKPKTAVDMAPDAAKIVLCHSIGPDVTLCEIFDFSARERISYIQKNGLAPGAPTREFFDDIRNQESALRPAFEKYKSLGGALDESVIAHRQKRAEETDIVIRRRGNG